MGWSVDVSGDAWERYKDLGCRPKRREAKKQCSITLGHHTLQEALETPR